MSKHARVHPITDPTDKVCKFMREHCAGERGLVSTADAILPVLFDKGLARCDKIAWEDLSVPDLQTAAEYNAIPDLLASIRTLGWDSCCTSHALCAVADPGDSMPDLNYKSYHPLSLRMTTRGMQCIKAKAESRDVMLGNGTHYDVEVIRQTDANMASAVHEGIYWVVLSWDVEYLYPGCFELMADSRNRHDGSVRCV